MKRRTREPGRPSCACGQGCNLIEGARQAHTGNVWSTRDIVFIYIGRHGPMPIYSPGALARGEGPTSWIQTMDAFDATKEGRLIARQLKEVSSARPAVPEAPGLAAQPPTAPPLERPAEAIVWHDGAIHRIAQGSVERLTADGWVRSDVDISGSERIA